MPRYYYDGARDTVDGAKQISIFWLNKRGLIRDFYSGSINWSCDGSPTGDIRFSLSTTEGDSYFRFIYKTKKHWETEAEYRSMDYKFRLESVSCNLGGIRWFFRCGLYTNGVYCGRRVGILYSTGDYFGCRFCSDLSYDSCNGSKKYRWLTNLFENDDKASKIYDSLRTKYYRGVPTKKHRRALALWRKTGGVDYESLLRKM